MLWPLLLIALYIWGVVKVSGWVRRERQEKRRRRVNIDPLCDTCGHASAQHVLEKINMDTLPNGHGAIRWRFRCGGVPVALELGCPCMSFKLSAADMAERLDASTIEGGVNG